MKTVMLIATLSDLALHLEVDALVRRGGTQQRAFRARAISARARTQVVVCGPVGGAQTWLILPVVICL